MCIGNKAENSSPDALVNLLSNITSEITHIMENAVWYLYTIYNVWVHYIFFHLINLGNTSFKVNWELLNHVYLDFTSYSFKEWSL